MSLYEEACIQYTPQASPPEMTESASTGRKKEHENAERTVAFCVFVRSMYNVYTTGEVDNSTSTGRAYTHR